MTDQEALSSSPFEALCRAATALFGVTDATVHRDGTAAAGAARACRPLLERWRRGEVGLEAGCLVVEDVATAAWFPERASGMLACAPVDPGDGRGVVALCLADPRPRRFPAEDRRRLADLAALAADLAATEARAAAAQQQADFFRMLAEHSTDTLVRGTLDGVRLYISPGVRTLLGYEPEEMIGRRARDITHPDDAEMFARVMADIRAGRIEQATTEHRQRHRDGRWVWMEAHIRLTRDGSGAPDGYVVSVRDVSHRKATEARLEHAALHDPLTGLANRTLFRDRLQREIARCRRTGAHFALFWVDLDRFKEVNDRLGHEAGDTVLKAVAERLKAVVRDEDTVARIGGDEFVVLRTAREGGEGASAAAALALRLAATTDDPVDCAGVPVRIGLSVGVSLTEVEGLEADRLLRAADRALYRAKDGGRGRAIVAR